MPSPWRHGVDTWIVDDYRRRQQELFGARLRRLRSLAHLKGADLAAQVGVGQPTISKIETGRSLPSVHLLQRIADALHVPKEQREELLEELSRVNTDIASWRRAAGRGEAKQQQIGERDHGATLRRSYHPVVVPGLLQTAEYARAIFARSMFLREDERARAVAARLDRQTVLYGEDHGFEFLISEAALQVRLGPPQLHRAQLDRIRQIAGLSNVRIGIIPLTAELPRVVPNGFALYDDTRVVVETFTSELALTDERDVETYGQLFDDLNGVAVHGGDVSALLARAEATLK